MDVEDFLPAVGMTICHQAVAAVGHAKLPCDPAGDRHEVAEEGLVFRPGVVEGGDVLFGDQHDMHRGRRVNVAEGQTGGVVMDGVSRDLPVADLAEDAFVHGDHSRAARPGLSRGLLGSQSTRRFLTGLGIQGLLGLVLLGAACAGAPKSSAARLDEALKRFHHDLRWQYNDTAASRVDPKHAADFQDQLDAQKDDLHITAYEIRRVDIVPEGSEARVRVRLNYYKMPSTVVHEDMVRQWWKQLEGAWRLVRVEGGPLRFPPADDEPAGDDPHEDQAPAVP